MKYCEYLSQFPRLDEKNIVVTGANSGIGLQTAKHLAWLGAEVIMACRNAERAAAARTYILTQVPDAKLEFASYDQASFSSIKAFAEHYRTRRLDGFVFNAGICGSKADLVTQEGFPLIFGTNFIGACYLTELLYDKFHLDETRLVYVSSLAGCGAKEQSPATFHSGSANRQYGYSKLCLAQYACELISEGLDAVVVHPGASGTGILFGKDSGF
ncbi:MAG: SDR family NAD(P)-dependent oxidoreductase, partial [Clostridiales bacterium]|nr:SDR family NAD(P)-dependent oxidoreductase [Clostridiales bacterium]